MYREVGAILRRHAQEIPFPSSVFHYTRLNAFVSIVQTGNIWCSNVAYANDPAEITYGDEILSMMLKQRYPDFALKGVFATLADIDYYAAAFSAEGDLLPQWRAYCDNGKGIAIGFDTLSIMWTTHMIFSRVEYDQKRSIELAAEVMSRYAEPIRRAASDEERWRLLQELALFFVSLRGIFKHPAYAAEREYRLFNTLPRPREAHDTHLLFRATASGLIPYYEIEVLPRGGVRSGRQTLNEVILGPCCDEPIESSVRAFLDQNGLQHVKVERSKVRMRAG
jgi:Protein of unknown function (DUF2971)